MLVFKKLYKFGITLVACALLSACVQNKDEIKQDVNLIKGHNVFGKNDKKIVSTSERQFQLIGKLVTPNGTCTASLVWKNLVLTAAHCVIVDGELVKGKFTFLLGESDGNAVAESEITHAWWGTTQPDTRRSRDWAILKLDKPLGEEYGYFGWKSSTPENLTNMMQAGYGGLFYKGSEMTGVKNCSFQKIFNSTGVIYHDCDSSRGDSGSPLFTCSKGSKSQCSIVALHVAEMRDGNTSQFVDEYSEEYANIAISTESFASKLLELRKENP